ncbi:MULTISPECIES: pyridoxine 5'-phosphate synthase [Rhodanobacter]|uniref:pyridoxine 5'-phosphate synthase n=1 Tax=Rhodanobacter TaxID=75309 RepID=UPI0004170E14|nr:MULTISPECIES: pyridoxine 5'-phosphate synthase [Rhodanobacter]TAN17763.1 MAG: pyridoxine 5'-phosphate synthase [Rhodanobacter sp.]UJJ54833.1 pyridoxine 5'-phosphate synthase [Rhodanobacter thiooxydans]
MTLLSVNLNKIAVLRNSRGGREPDICRAAQTCIESGCGGITVHPRPDLRHVRPDDVRALAAMLRGRVEYNIEGNPFAAARGAYPGLVALAREVRPTQVTLVPDGDGQITSDHGFDLRRDLAQLRPLVGELRELGCRVSLFVDAGSQDFELAAAIGAQRIEIYTGPYAEAFTEGQPAAALAVCAETARRAQQAGLAVNAGHDLSQANLGTFKAAIPGLAEVSIGHALIGEALYEGLATTVRNYLQILR